MLVHAPHRRWAPLVVSLMIGCSPEQLGCERREVDTAVPTPDAPVTVVDPRPAAEVEDARTVVHSVRFPTPHDHHVEIELDAPAGGDALELMMAVWTPGSYLVREFARHVEAEHAIAPDGTPLRVEKIAKNRWRITAAEGPLPARVRFGYRLYARELSVRTSFVDADVAVLTGAATFLTPVDQLDLAHEVRLTLPEAWPRCATSLDRRSSDAPASTPDDAEAPAVEETESPTAEAREAEAVEPEAVAPEAPETVGAPNAPPARGGELRFLARNFDELVDSPIVCGDVDVRAFEVSGVGHELATVGGLDVWDHERAARDVARIVATQHAFWRVVPYDRFVFLNGLLDSGGGLEHARSTLVMASRWDARDEDDYRAWLSLISHELFHTWNVKRLRPRGLGPFDYEREHYLHELWVVEGITSYYDDLLVRRAGLSTRGEYLGALSKQIERLQTTPGRAVQSLAASSFDTWIKFYRPDEHARSRRVSYYVKGALVAFLLDVELRKRGRSLDEVMRAAYERFAEAGYTGAELAALIDEIAGAPLGPLLERYVEGTGELDYAPALEHFGLRFRPSDSQGRAWLGAELRAEGGRLLVREVPSGTPAHDAGVAVDDELIAIDDERLPTDLDRRLARLRAGEAVDLLVARRGRLRRLRVVLGERPSETWRLELDPAASATQRRNLESWLGAERAE
ncbi:MAG: M61 family metallopeptidase [Myxococcales bacterium]|nr:M61 family metallopeptidase [Myxococcales bacterium]